jgi:hypothetical protein
MFKRTVEIDLACSPEQAFRHIAVEFFENHPRWDPDIVELIKTSQGPIGLGTTGREQRVMDGRRFVTDFRVSEFRPNDAFAHRTTKGAMAEDVDYLIRPSGDCARLTLRLHIYPRNPLLWTLAPAIRPRIERNFQANLARFERMVNAKRAPQGVG